MDAFGVTSKGWAQGNGGRKLMVASGQNAAIVMRQYGGPEVLRLETASIASLKPDEVRIRSIASAVNHSDLEIRAGNWPIFKAEPFPYTPGLEVVGEVVEVGASVSDISVGDRVITMMQGLGGVHPQRPGGYAEYVTVSCGTVAAFSKETDPLGMAALGLASVTAFEGLRKIGDLNSRRIVVTGAAGGVGSTAVAIAKAQGAEVIGVISNAAQEPYVRSLGASKTVVSQDVAVGALARRGVVDIVWSDGEASRPLLGRREANGAKDTAPHDDFCVVRHRAARPDRSGPAGPDCRTEWGRQR